MDGQFRPNVVKYNKGSYIIYEGKSDTARFFIIQAGKVLISREVDTAMGTAGNVIGPGEMFGVVSAMAGQSYIETAVAVEDVTLLAIDRKQYEDLVRSNTPIAMAIIQQFSLRLRNLNDALSLRSLNSAGVNNPSHLYQVGEFYAASRRYNHAFYAYQAYIKFCPDGEFVESVREKMMKIAPMVKTTKPVYPTDKRDRLYPADCLLFAEGEPGDELYVIQEGTVKITKIVSNKEVVLAVLEKGDIFGEMALLEDKPRTANVETYGKCSVLAVNRANFEGMIKDQLGLVSRLTILLAERIWYIYKQLANTFIESPVGRIYDALLTQLEKEKVPLNITVPHTCKFGFKELASLAGIPSQEGDRLFKKFLLEGRITEINDKLVVKDVSEVIRQTEYFKRAKNFNHN